VRKKPKKKKKPTKTIEIQTLFQFHRLLEIISAAAFP